MLNFVNAELIKRKQTRNSLGVMDSEEILIDIIQVSFPENFSSAKSLAEYGVKEDTTCRVFTNDDLKDASYMKINGTNYFIQQIITFRNHKEVLLNG